MAPTGYKYDQDGDYYQDFNGNVHSVQAACRAYTKAGVQCTNQIEAGGNTFCKMHNLVYSREIKRLRKAGKSQYIHLDEPVEVKVKATVDTIADSPYAGNKSGGACFASPYGGSRFPAFSDSSSTFGQNSSSTYRHNGLPTSGRRNSSPEFGGHSAPAFGGSITRAFGADKASPSGSSIPPAPFENQTRARACPGLSTSALGVQRREGLFGPIESLTWSTWLTNTDVESALFRAPFLRETFLLRCKQPGWVPDNFDDHAYFHSLMESFAVCYPLSTMPPLASGPNPQLKVTDFPELSTVNAPLLSSKDSLLRNEWVGWLDANTQLQRYQFLHDYFQCSVQGNARKKPENILGHLYFDQLGKLYEILLMLRV